jgi:uridine kinase
MEVREHKPLPPVIIGIAGGSGSGKTTVAHRVREACPGKTIQIIHHDSYYFDNSHLPMEQRARINYDHPNAFETALLVEHLQMLQRGETVVVPRYDYAIHSRLAETTRCEPADIVFVEGILVLESAALRELMDIRLYVDVDADERVLRRLLRDTAERGRTMESVITQYLSVVRPMHLQFVLPSKRYAHIIIPEGGQNEVAIDLIATKIQDIIRERDRLRALDRQAQAARAAQDETK